MAVQIIPVISVAQDVYDYCNISGAQAAATLPNGTTTLAAWVALLLGRTAQSIVAEINYDFTATQVQWLRGFGNALGYIETPWPVATITAFTSWDPTSPATAPINIGAGVLAVPANNPFTLYRNDSDIFSSSLRYYIEVTQAIDQQYNGWPAAIKEIQCEMIQLIYNESANLTGHLDKAEFEGLYSRSLSYKPLEERFKAALRPWKRFTA